MRPSNHQALYQRCQWDPAHANTHWLWHHRHFVSLVGKLWQGDYKAKARTYWWKIYTTYLPKRNQSSNFNEATLQVIPTNIGVSFPWSMFAFFNCPSETCVRWLRARVKPLGNVLQASFKPPVRAYLHSWGVWGSYKLIKPSLLNCWCHGTTYWDLKLP